MPLVEHFAIMLGKMLGYTNGIGLKRGTQTPMIKKCFILRKKLP